MSGTTDAEFKKTALRKVPLLAGLRDAEIGQLAARANLFTKEADETLFEEGTRGEEVWIALERAEVALWKGFGDEREFLGTRGGGAVLGEMSVLDGSLRSATAVVRARSRFLTLHKADLLAVMESNPRIAIEIIRVLCQRLRESDEGRLHRSTRRVAQRLAAYLLDNATVEEATGRSYVPRTTDGEIAGRIGTEREVVNRTLGKWHEHKLIERTDTRLYIRDREALAAIVEGNAIPRRGARQKESNA